MIRLVQFYKMGVPKIQEKNNIVLIEFRLFTWIA